MMIDVSLLSSIYEVRRLDDSYADDILELCKENTQFYQYTEAEPTEEQILEMLHVTPPGMEMSSKYYVGYYLHGALIAVMDLIDGYPAQDVAYIGFFMMNKAFQGRQIGSGIISEAAKYLKSQGKTAIRLAIDQGNPQSTHFWKKNGFCVIREVERQGWIKLVAEKML